MKKLIATAALAVIGLTLSAPAMANMAYDSSRINGTTCRVDTDGERHCWNHVHRWYSDRQFVSQEGQDVNSNTWTDGSVRATLPPHNSRGTSRPDTGEEGIYWMNW